MAVSDVWGNIPLEVTIRPPLQVLKEQAALLGQKTKNILEGRVTTSVYDSETDEIVHRLHLVVPLLDGYSIHLASLVHDESLYPLTLVDVLNELGEKQIVDEEHLLQGLAEIVQSHRAQNMIRGLIAQALVV